MIRLDPADDDAAMARIREAARARRALLPLTIDVDTFDGHTWVHYKANAMWFATEAEAEAFAARRLADTPGLAIKRHRR